MLECKKLTKIYQSKKSEAPVEALSSVSLTLPDTGMVFVLGKSGSGKTTLLNILGGLDRPTSGQLLVDGKSISDVSGKELDSFRNTFVGFVFQDFALIDGFTVGQNVAFALELQGQRKNREKVRKALSAVGLEGFENRRINTLSGGQKQRVSIARALVKDPRIVLADEPTGALDSETGNSVLSEMKKLSLDKLVIVVSHDRESAERFADRIIELKDGKVLKDRTISQGDSASSPKPLDKLKKPVLPFWKAMQIGVSSAFKKPFRLSVSVLLVASSLSFFGLLSTAAIHDEARMRHDAAIKLHTDTDLFYKRINYDVKRYEYDYLSDKVISSSDTKATSKGLISKDELESLNSSSKNGLRFAGVYGAEKYQFEVMVDDDYESPVVGGQYICPFFSGFTDCGSAFLEDNGFSFLAGSYPKKTNEIAISRYHAEMLEAYKLDRAWALDYDGGLIDLDFDYSDVVGTTIRMTFNDYGFDLEETLFTVSGVIDTGDLDDYYLKTIAESNGRLGFDFTQAFSDCLRGSYQCLGFVADDFYDMYGQAFVSTDQPYRQADIEFTGLAINKDKANLDNGVSVAFSRFVDLNDYSFYDLDGKEKIFKEPKGNEVYINGLLVKEGFYTKLQTTISNLFALIKEACEKKLLPELSRDLGARESLEKCISFTHIKDVLKFAELFEGGYLKDDMERLNNAFTSKAFKRLYIHDALRGIIEADSYGMYEIEDLKSTSDFYVNMAEKILYPDDDLDVAVFDDLLTYFQNHQALETFAVNIRNLELAIMMSNASLKAKVDEIFNLIYKDHQGERVTDSLWAEFNELFLRELSKDDDCSLYGIPCSKSNIISFDCDLDPVSLDQKLIYPETLAYVNNLGVKGQFDVVGFYVLHSSDPYSYMNDLYFLNEGFINSIAVAPNSFSYDVVSTSYHDDLKGRYNYFITKSDFSVEEIREICKKGSGYEYCFSLEPMGNADTFLFFFRESTWLFVAAALILGSFAVVLLATLISGSIEAKKKEIGVIRCLGGRQSDIFAIFAVESVFVSVCASIIASLVTFGVCSLLNQLYKMTIVVDILHFGHLHAILVFGLAIIFGLMSTLVPIIRRTSMQPYVALRKE